MIRLLLLSILLFSIPSYAKTYALIIGVNEYPHSQTFGNLKGAVNDAELIYKTLQDIGVPRDQLVKLTNQQASKAKIEAAWGALIGRSNPKDTLIFSFAGHGTQEQDENGDEALIDPEDKWDETLLLSGYAESPRKANDERLVDDEMYTLFKRAKGRRVIYVADSCHSGGTFRNIDLRAKQSAWQSRKAPAIRVKLSKPSIKDSTQRLKEIDLDNFFFFAATESRKPSLEGIINGVPHGALSWAFAQVLREALATKKKSLNFSEMQAYIATEVKNKTDHRQFTDIRPRGGGSEVLFELKKTAKVSSNKLATATSEVIKLNIIGKNPKWIKHLEALQLSEQDPDLIWDRKAGEVLNKQGDITAYHIKQRSDIAQVINRIRLLRVIDQLAKGHFINSQLSAVGSTDKNQHAKLHHFGDEVAFYISGLKYQHLYQFNLAGNGEVQCFPAERVQREKKHDFEASSPAGNDSLITLILKKPSAQLAQLVTEKSCGQAMIIQQQLPALLKGRDYQLGRVDVFTSR